MSRICEQSLGTAAPMMGRMVGGEVLIPDGKGAPVDYPGASKQRELVSPTATGNTDRNHDSPEWSRARH